MADVKSIYGNPIVSKNDHTHSNKGTLDNLTQDVINNSHNHNNKSTLDNLTQTVITNSHSHSNSTVLNNLTQTVINNSHTHGNKSAVDNLTQSVIDDSHSHSNQDVLNGITSDNVFPKNHASSATTYGLGTNANYGHVKLGGNTTSTNYTTRSAFPIAYENASSNITSFNTTTYLNNGIYHIRFAGSATGAPSGLTSSTTYYGTLIAYGFATSTSATQYSTTYGVCQILTIPRQSQIYVRYSYSGSSTYGTWTPMITPAPTVVTGSTTLTGNEPAGTIQFVVYDD